MKTETKERPILFSTEMVKAILNESKTQTRRIVKHKNEIEEIYPVMRTDLNLEDWGNYVLVDEHGEDFLIKPKFETGDTMWVRETFCEFAPGEFAYKTDEKIEGALKWKPSIHMPKAACRLILEVTDVRIERVHDISEEDAISEGVKIDEEGMNCWDYVLNRFHDNTPVCSFQSLWELINGKESWDSNPWVFVYDFEILIAKI